MTQASSQLGDSEQALLKCDDCGLESEISESFVNARKWYLLRKSTYCPTCWSKQVGRWTKRDLLFWGLWLTVVLILIAVNPQSRFGWLLVNMFLVLLFFHLLVIPHELGHAIAGRLLGMRVFRIVIGDGRTVFSLQVAGLPLEVRSSPGNGYAFVMNKSATMFRMKLFLTVLSGPLVSIAILIVILNLPSEGLPSAIFTDTGLFPLSAFFWANNFVLAIALWPSRYTTPEGEVPRDGLGLLTIPFLSESKIAERLQSYYSMEAGHFRKHRQLESARNLVEQSLEDHPSSPILLSDLGITLIEMRQYEKARDCFLKVLNMEALTPAWKATALNNIAYSDVLIEREELVPEADRFSAAALASAPWATAFKGTRGMVLVELGQYEEGIALLAEALKSHEECEARALNACYIAIAESRRGNEDRSRHFLNTARRLDPSCLLLSRAERSLVAAQSIEGAGGHGLSGLGDDSTFFL